MSKEEYLDTKVTNINGIFHIRLIDTRSEKILGEVSCNKRDDIGYCVRFMMRMHDKCGGTSPMADASRHRGKNINPIGKVKYHHEKN